MYAGVSVGAGVCVCVCVRVRVCFTYFQIYLYFSMFYFLIWRAEVVCQTPSSLSPFNEGWFVSH